MHRVKKLIVRTEDGFYRLPAFVDAHVHVESSHLSPARFGCLIAAHGTLTAICDPHEIVNVTGEAGLDFMLADAKRSPARLLFALPSCVPATPFETSGAALSAASRTAFPSTHPTRPPAKTPRTTPSACPTSRTTFSARQIRPTGFSTSSASMTARS